MAKVDRLNMSISGNKERNPFDILENALVCFDLRNCDLYSISTRDTAVEDVPVEENGHQPRPSTLHLHPPARRCRRPP